jgi:hypothetical protein
MRKEMISNAFAVIHNSGRVCTLWEADANASSLTSGGNLYFPKSGMEDKSPIQVHKICDISVSVCEAVL